jgi:hypothetical protein
MTPSALFCTDPHYAFLYRYAGQTFKGQALWGLVSTRAQLAEDLVQGDTNGNGECKEVRSSELLLHDSCGEILQRAMRNDGKNA